MAIDVTMPQMGADMTEGTLVRWLKQVGDDVQRGEILAEIETDKATVELEAFDAGTLKKQIVGEGDTVPVGQVIAILGSADEEVDAETPVKPRPEVADRHVEGEARRAPDKTPEEQSATTHTGPDEDEAPAASGGRVRVSPVARRIAADAGIDLAKVTGTGPDGRILRRDVEAMRAGEAPARATKEPAGLADEETVPAPKAAPPAPRPAPAQRGAQETEIVPLSRMRQAIARRMSQSKREQPCYYLTLDVDMTDALAFRQQVNAVAPEDHRVSINDLVVKALAIALVRHPKFNSEYSDEGLKIHHQINIDIAIALDEGLIAPAIIDCGTKSLGTIAAEARDLIGRAKDGRLRADEYSAGTFSITNLGNFGVETLIGIIKPPHAAILGVGSVAAKPVVKNDEIVIRQVMKIALSADHRVSDGAEGARFIKEIQRILEAPATLAL